MSGYSPTSVAAAGEILGPAIGLSWRDDRREVVTYINRYRNLLYNRYERQRLFENVWQCFVPQRFCNQCVPCDPCQASYLGITLPREMAGISAAWSYGIPLHLRSAWRENFTGRAPVGGLIGDLVEIRENFPTERDPKTPSTLQVFAESLSDDGKAVFVEARTPDGKTVKLQFPLHGDNWSVSEVVVSQVLSVILPAELKGYVTLAAGDYELSVYAPSERAPAYKRFKLPSNCGASSILVQGTRQYVDVYFDHDLVEIGDRMVLEFMGQYFKYWKSKDTTEINVGDKALANAWAEIDGLVARDSGGIKVQPQTTSRSRCPLPGYGRRGIYSNFWT